MLAPRTLSGLEQRKFELRSQIARGRSEIARAIAPGVRLLAWVDVGWLVWRRIPRLMKIAAVPASVSIAASLLVNRRWKWLQRWLPVFCALARGVQMARIWNRKAGEMERTPHEPAAAKDAQNFPRTAQQAP